LNYNFDLVLDIRVARNAESTFLFLLSHLFISKKNWMPFFFVGALRNTSCFVPAQVAKSGPVRQKKKKRDPSSRQGAGSNMTFRSCMSHTKAYTQHISVKKCRGRICVFRLENEKNFVPEGKKFHHWNETLCNRLDPLINWNSQLLYYTKSGIISSLSLVQQKQL